MTKEQLKFLFFVFLAGAIGDVIIHLLAEKGVVGMSLLPYYKSLGNDTTAYFLGAFLGGLACVIGAVGGHLLMKMF
jgi:hypothetical protein